MLCVQLTDHRLETFLEENFVIPYPNSHFSVQCCHHNFCGDIRICVFTTMTYPVWIGPHVGPLCCAQSCSKQQSASFLLGSTLIYNISICFLFYNSLVYLIFHIHTVLDLYFRSIGSHAYPMHCLKYLTINHLFPASSSMSLLFKASCMIFDHLWTV